MTPEQHLAEAERLVADAAENARCGRDYARATALAAIATAHASIATAKRGQR